MENLKMKTNVKIIKNGEVVVQTHNLIVNTGLAQIAGLLLTDVSGTAFDYIAIGTGTTAVNAADTTLETEVMRVAGTGTRKTSVATNDTASLSSTFTIDGTYAITEAGIFNASSLGVLLNHVTFDAINVVLNDTLTIVWDITFANA